VRVSGLVLLHSPLTGPAAWGRLPDALQALGYAVSTVDVTDDDQPPYATRYVARAALQIAAANPPDPVVLVGHSGAGPLLSSVALARRAAHRPVAGYLFLDAGPPPAAAPASRLDLMRAEDADVAADLEAELVAGGSFPAWSDDDLRDTVPDDRLRAELVASLRPRPHDFFAEPLPTPPDWPDWPDAPCGYLKTSAAYDAAARTARARQWPLVERGGGHFAALVDPGGLAVDMAALLDRM